MRTTPEPIDNKRENGTDTRETQLWALLEGKLSPEQAANMRQSLNSNAKLKALFDDILEQHNKMLEVDEKVLSEPIPDRLLKIVRDAKARIK